MPNKAEKTLLSATILNWPVSLQLSIKTIMQQCFVTLFPPNRFFSLHAINTKLLYRKPPATAHYAMLPGILILGRSLLNSLPRDIPTLFSRLALSILLTLLFDYALMTGPVPFLASLEAVESSLASLASL